MEISAFIKSIPVLRMLMPFATGICSGIALAIYAFNAMYALVLMVVVCVVLFILNRIIVKPVFSTIKGFSISFLFFMSGYCLIVISPTQMGLPEEQTDGYWLCRVRSFPVEKNKTYQVGISTEGLYDSVFRVSDNFSMYIYFRKDTICEDLAPGDILLIRMKPVRPMQNGNPYEFDYRGYLFRKGIYYQAFAGEGDWLLFQKNDIKWKYLPLFIQHQFVSRLKGIVSSPDNFGIISALSVGTRDFIDEEIKTAYSDVGAMHVLAVSGLHVGLVWYVLNIIFGRLKYNHYTRFLYWIIMTALLWLYVMITGMTPSVTRAGIMLTLVVTSTLMRRGSSSSNPVFLSAFILLAINPILILDVGFQFSYLAVFGILFFQPKLTSLWKLKNPVFKYLWELFTVSLAAQAGTIIPAIYYFNKFPVYFVLTNFVVVPLVTIILFCIIISAFFWFSDPIFIFLSQCSGFFTGIMNSGVKLIESLPGASLKQLYIDRVDAFILGMGLLCLMLFINKRRIHWLMITSLCLCGFFIYSGIRDSIRKNKVFVAVHNLPGILSVDLNSNGLHFFITLGLNPEKESQIIRSCNNFWLYERTDRPVFIDLENPVQKMEGIEIINLKDSRNWIIVFNNRVFAIVNNLTGIDSFIAKDTICLDMLICNTSGLAKPTALLSVRDSGYLVVSSGFRGSLRLTEYDGNLNIHKVVEDGAFVRYFVR